MNAVEIEEAVSLFAANPCELEHFPFQFLARFATGAGLSRATITLLYKETAQQVNLESIEKV